MSNLDYLKAHMYDGCGTLWPFGKSGKYGYVHVPGIGPKTVQSVVCEIVHGPKPYPEYEAAHNCGIHLCFNAECVNWATPTENAADREHHGNTVRGEKNKGGGKLTEIQVREIKRLRNQGNPITKISIQFGIDTTMVSKICRGVLWSHIE